ncbi:MAG: superoxide dismutase family protein [Candidatus Scalinduaceae bacterium]
MCVCFNFFDTFVVCRIVEIPVFKLSETIVYDKQIGYIIAEDTPDWLLLSPSLERTITGLHGFHVHQNPDCSPKEKGGKMIPGLGVGSHYDPAITGKHLGSYLEGHLDDLPVLWVNSDGKADALVLAPRVKVSNLKGRSLIIYADRIHLLFVSNSILIHKCV